MNEEQRRAFPSRQIPKRPSQLPEQSSYLPKRSSLLPVPQPPEQPSSLPEPSSVESDELDNRSLFAEMATVKRKALQPKASLERKTRVTSYPALVNHAASRPSLFPESMDMEISYPPLINGKRSRIRDFLALAIPFLK